MTASNPYYQETFTASDGQNAKARALDAQFQLIQQAFDLLWGQIESVKGLSGMRFIDLADVPNSYSGAGLLALRVNAGAGGVEFAAGGKLNIKALGVTSYTTLAEDAGQLLLLDHADPISVTVESGVHAAGDVVLLQQYGAGRVTLVEGAGVTINSSDSLLDTRTTGATVGLVCLDAGGTNFLLVGERNAPSLAYAVLAGGNQFTGTQAVDFVALTDAATIDTDASLGNNFRVTLGGNRVLANPTNLRDGACLNWRIKQDGAGTRTLTYGSKFKWPGGAAPTLSTAAGAVDIIAGIYVASDDRIECVCTKGFS